MKKIDPIDIALESYKHRKKYFENYAKIAKRIKNFLEKKGIRAKVIVFGSVVKGKQTPLSDLDILIVSDNINENKYAKLSVEIKEMLKDPFAPIEFHFANTKIFENWYKNFLDKWVEI